MASGTGGNDAGVVEVVDALTTGAAGETSLLKGKPTGYGVVGIAVAASQVVTGDDGEVAAQLGDVGQAYDETGEPHVEAGVSVEGRAVGLACAGEVAEKELVSTGIDGDSTPLPGTIEGGVELGDAVDGGEGELRRQ